MDDQRSYQHEFSQINPAMHDAKGRRRKAATMVEVCKDAFDRPLSDLTVLDVGGSTGFIDDFLADYFQSR